MASQTAREPRSDGRITLLPGNWEPVMSLVRDADGNLRGALLYWSIALTAMIILRARRQIVLVPPRRFAPISEQGRRTARLRAPRQSGTGS
jgi:hypothetical protein